MKSKRPPTRIERQHVYLRYREVFTGKNALLRTKKDIISAIEALNTSKPLAIQHQKRKTISILRTLLEAQIFQSEEQAREEFPELWLQTPKRNKAFTRGEVSQLIKLEDFENDILPQSRPQSTSSKERISFPLKDSPLKFSYEHQHRILAMTQQILEESCFNFTQAWLASMLSECGWTCAAAVELTKWLKVMLKRLDTVPEECIDASGRAMFRTIEPRLAYLRHSAVHRLTLDPDRVLEMVDAASTLAKILRDKDCTSKLQALHTRLAGIISQTKCDTEAVQQEIDQESLSIQTQRMALNLQEQELQKYAAEKFSGLSKAADSSLLECAYILRGVKEEEKEKVQDVQFEQQHCVLDPTFYVGEGDIESDEDQLKADLD